MDPELKRSLEEAIRSATGQAFSIASARPVSGGCIHRSWLLSGSGERYFAKTNDASRRDVLEAEADGLRALAAAGARAPVPVDAGASGRFSWLVMEHLALGHGDGASHAALGRMLAAVHGTAGATFGWRRDNFIGSTPQGNAPAGDWTEFWRERRLRPQLALAARAGHASLVRPGEHLCSKLDRLLHGHHPEPSLLHGDLWRGNAGFVAGAPVLFDPAVYLGDREADLAMTELFGGFPPPFYAAYREAARLDSGYELRRTLYNLYHVLNHAHLFGGAYPAQAERMIRQLLAEI